MNNMSAFLLSILILFTQVQGELPSVPVSPEIAVTTEAPMDCIYYDRAVYTQAIHKPNVYEIEGRLTGGMIPHHLLAADMIAGFFTLAAQQEKPYDKVLIVSPSHFPENCSSDVVTATADWNTPYGILKTDRAMTNAILENPLIGAENSAKNVEYDHGVAGLIPFVKYYLPDAEVSVCLLSNRLSQKRLEEVQRVIKAQSQGQNILVLASADCSHYLTYDAAKKRDIETAAAIEGFRYEQIMGFSDSNVDSPQAVTTFMTVAQAQGSRLVQLDNSISSDKLPHMLDNPIFFEGVTSYYVYGAVGR